MKHLTRFSIATALSLLLVACNQTSEKPASVTAAPAAGGLLTPQAFSVALQNTPEAIILDVRTPEEYASGHIAGAQNIDISGSDFQTRVAAMDPSRPVFVYCLSGSRSASAAGLLRKKGFKVVNDLQGGMMQWRAAQLPLEQGGASAKKSGMTQKDFDALLQTDKLVLIDFYAVWCQPCKRMEPYLAEINREMSDKVNVVRIDVEANRAVAEQLGVTALPTLMLYKKGVVAWRHEGFIEKEAVVKKLTGV